MNLTQVTNESLLSRTRELAQEERRLINELLHHLLEIESRKLYHELGHPSLFAYVTRELHYSESSAQRRIEAARLLKQVPALEEKLESGVLTLGSVGKAQQYFRAESKRGLKLSPAQKEEVVFSLSGMSTREAEAKLAESNPDAFRQERVREIGSGELAVAFTLSRELRAKLERVKEVHSHVDPSMGYGELVGMLAEFYLKKKDPAAKATSQKAPAEKVVCDDTDPEGSEGVANQNAQSLQAARVPISLPQRRSGALSRQRRALPRVLQREVRRRDQNQCVWLLPNGQKCGSRWQLEIDHIHPYAMGGADTPDNLRCLCRAHNMLAAVAIFGNEKLSGFGVTD